MGFVKNVWHHVVPLKWPFLIWRALQKCLPVDEYLINKGFQLASKCGCCVNPQLEIIIRVFVNSDVAEQVWNYFKDIFKIHSMGNLLSHKINIWWLQKVRSPCYKAILSLIPNAICWGINRNNGKYEKWNRGTDQIIFNIKHNVRRYLG